MLLMLVLIVMIVSVALLLALFSGFLPFVNTYGNVMQYTTAYYGAISALERGSLAVRYAGPGFDGESGWRDNTSTGNGSDKKLNSFYTYGSDNNTLLWNVKSSTNRIPSLGNGNVESAFIINGNKDSLNYNTLDYNKAELIPLGTVGDVTPDEYYSDKKAFTGASFGGIQGQFRLNPFLLSNFSGGSDQGLLCQDHCPNTEGWKDSNQVVVTRTIKGKYLDSEFTLLPKDATNLNKQNIDSWDTLIRKNNINTVQDTENNISFGDNKHPLKGHISTSDNYSLNIISNHESELSDKTFAGVISDQNVSDPYLSFSLVNYLWSKGKNLYPFLEYEFHTTNGSKISDRFYTIKGEGKVGSYNVRLQIQKPTLKQPALGNFTIIF